MNSRGIDEFSTDEGTEVNQWTQFGMKLAVSSALHPFEYAKVLIQVGYEPIAPKPGRSLLGNPVLVLPNVFTYVGYIKRVDGLRGCYRGLMPKLVGSVVSSFGSEKVANKLGISEIDESKDETELSEEECYQRFHMKLKRDIVLHAAGIVLSQPFHVVSVRMMAQFVGREVKYTSVMGSILEIWRDEGVFGLFSGLVPRLIGDMVCLVLTSTTTYYINKHLIKTTEERKYVGGFTQFVYASILYPFHLVSTCMIVSGSGLTAGKPPNMPIFKNWRDCWNTLSVAGDLKRGSSLFFRYAYQGRKSSKLFMAPMPAVENYK